MLSALLIIGIGFATATTAYYGPQVPNLHTPLPTQIPPQSKSPVTKPPVTKPPEPARVSPVLTEPVPGITFADKSGVTYVVARTLARRLRLDIELSPDEKVLRIGDKEFTEFRRLFSGEILFPIRAISKLDGTIEATTEGGRSLVRCFAGQFELVVGKKHVEIDKAAQELTAYQGDVVVLKTNVSTGRPGHNTPNGEFTTGYKERMHYSHKYNDAEMPYAVEVNGDVFFHGYTSVPHYPASHGCIRIPLGHKNPAKYLFTWVNHGVDVKIFGAYNWESHHSRKRHKLKK
jgi:hypothetical protein